MYVILEGIDGCGKSTQIELLKEHFSNAVITKEPGGTEFGKQAREILLHGSLHSKNAELLLFLADRAEHFCEIVQPNLENMVISDRGFLSGIAYAITNDPSLDLEFLIELNRFALQNQLPDKTVIFEIDKKELMQRVGSKEQDRIEKRGYDYLLKIQENLFKTADFMQLDYLKADATQKIEDINSQIIEYISK